MKLRVEIKNKILGDSVFWEGDSKRIKTIRNIVAKQLATETAKDGKCRTEGMWMVSEIKDD